MQKAQSVKLVRQYQGVISKIMKCPNCQNTISPKSYKTKSFGRLEFVCSNCGAELESKWGKRLVIAFVVYLLVTTVLDYFVDSLIVFGLVSTAIAVAAFVYTQKLDLIKKQLSQE